MKESDIPAIRGNPRQGKQKPTDASEVYTTGKGTQTLDPSPKKPLKVPTRAKKRKRKTKQQAFTITDMDGLRKLAKELGLSMTATVNLALSRLAKKEMN